MSSAVTLDRSTLAPLSVVVAVALAAWHWSAHLTDIQHGVREVGSAVGRIESRLGDYVTTAELRAWIAQARAGGASLPEFHR